MRVIIGAVALIVALNGCTLATKSDTPPGVVTDRGRRWVEVREDASGKTVRHRVSKSRARRCTSGERWPEC